MDTINLNRYVFSDGQVASLNWLCDELERRVPSNRVLNDVWVYQPWVGLFVFLLLNRKKLSIRNIRFFDSQTENLKSAKILLDHWVGRGETQLHFHHHNVQKSYPLFAQPEIDYPDLIINLAADQFENSDWWKHLPPGVSYIIQSSDIQIPEKTSFVRSVSELKKQLEILKPVSFEGTKNFTYSSFQFNRFMIMGEK